jgi:spore maturation protein CgeB
MRIIYFTHSLTSCWNHGNAHFLRGLLRELASRGHAVTSYEPEQAWSRQNLIAEHGELQVTRFRARFHQVDVRFYGETAAVEAMLDGADLVVVHEWTAPETIAAIGAVRKRGGSFVLLFHDTHHRAVSDPSALRKVDLSGYDGVLAFASSLAEVYRRNGWGRRVFVLHEAADTRTFRPLEGESDQKREGVVWIGNWGDGERSNEISTFLLEPAHEASLPIDVYGVRYPASALRQLAEHGARYLGWLPNIDVPKVFARYPMTVHIPRCFYAAQLPGTPTIRVFEALACGIPLICAPWEDSEHLFEPGADYLVAADKSEMRAHMRDLSNDPSLRASLARSGLERIRARHTCAHRADQLLAICAEIATPFAGVA